MPIVITNRHTLFYPILTSLLPQRKKKSLEPRTLQRITRLLNIILLSTQTLEVPYHSRVPVALADTWFAEGKLYMYPRNTLKIA